MKLSVLLNQGNTAALELVKSAITNPVVISTNPSWAIPLELTQNVQSGQAEVTELPIITTDSESKQVQNDTVAPHPWTWQLAGYIPGNSQIEMTNVFCPILMKNIDFLRNAYENGSRVIYKDADQHIYTNCVIQSLTIENKSDAKNKRPFSMVLKQIKEIKTELANLTEAQKNATPAGSEDKGNVVTEEVEKDITLLQEQVYKIKGSL